MDIKIIYNNVYLDSFFLKSMMIYDNTANKNATSVKNHYGDVVIGSTFRFVTTKLNDEKVIAAGSQLVQSTYNALLPPYVHFGVGRSNNYIESFNAAFSFKPVNLTDIEFQVLMKTPIIPNS